MLRKIFNILFLLAFELVYIFKYPFERTIFLEELHGCFFPNPWNSWNIIYRITHEPKNITHQVHVGNVPFFTDLLGSHHIYSIAHKGRLVEKNMLVHQLTIVLVWGHHVHRKLFLLRLFCNGADDVVCLKSIHFQNRNFEGPHDLLDPRDGYGNVLRLLQSIGLVGGILHVAKSGCLRIKCHCDVAWFFFFQDFQERVGKAKHYACIESFGIDPWVFAEGKMGPINQGHGIQKKKFMGLSL